MPRKSLTDRELRRPIETLFTSKQDDKNTSKQDDKDVSIQSNKVASKQDDKSTSSAKTKYIRKTYHLTQELVDGLAAYSVFENIDRSEIVRKALQECIPEKYLKMGENIKK